MSGGHFNYDQYRIGQIADEIQHRIETNDLEDVDKWGDKIGRFYNKEVIEKFQEAVKILKTGEIYAQRIDWLLSGDDGEESFLRRLKEDLEKRNEN
jgi:hypothetical protein